MIWQIETTRIVRKYKLGNNVIDCIEWCPIKERCALAVCNEDFVYIINPALYSKAVNQGTSEIFEQAEKQYKQEVLLNEKKEQFQSWTFPENDGYGRKMIKITYPHIIKLVVWHSKGDYFATMAHNLQSSTQVVINSLSKATSQRPFT